MGIGRGRWGGMLALAGIVALGMSLAFGVPANASPQYNIECSDCHDMPPADSGTTKKDKRTGAVPGSHQKHANASVSSCVVCHGSVATVYDTSHRNKVIELNDSFGYSRKVNGFLNQTSIPPVQLGTCATAACHSDGKGTLTATPAWGSAPFQSPTDCGQCHGVAPNTGNHPVAGSKHASYFGTGTDSCGKCHSDHRAEANAFGHATSVGKRGIAVKFAGGGSFAASQCSNLYCHSNGKGSFTPPTWGATLDCAGCHGNATSTGPQALSGRHQSHVNNASFLGSNYGCVECHAGTVSNDSTIANFNNHANGSADLSGPRIGTPVSGTCATAYCHSDGKGTQKSVTWTGSETLSCASCHGSDAAAAFTSVAGEPNYANAGADQARANSHQNHVAGAADCQNCHSATTVNGISIKPGGAHTDGSIEVAAGNGKSFAIAGKSCSNVSCHSGNGILTAVPDAKWGASLGCVGCHGDASTLASNAHAKHVNLTTGKGYNCETCHQQTVSGSSTITPAGKAFHGDNSVEVSGANLSFTSATKGCATSCHLTGAPKWNLPSTGACGTCHSALSTTSGGLIATKAHAKHFSAAYGPKFDATTAASCSNCHSSSTAATHANGTVNLASGINKIGTCANCHKQTTDWTSSARVSCESCHSTAGGALSFINKTAPDKTLAASKGHGAQGEACVSCHDSNSAHIGVAGGTNRLSGGLSGDALCNTCHNDDQTVSASALNMQVHVGSANNCAACHDPHGTANNNMLRTTLGSTAGVSFSGSDFVNGSGTGVCQACHTGTAYFKQGVPESNHPTTGCLDCHKHNTASGTAFEPNRACDSCHGYPPAPRSTIRAVSFGVMGSWSSARFEDYSGGGGAHVVAGHISKSAKASDGWLNCIPCHSGGATAHAKALPLRNHVDNVSVEVDAKYRFSGEEGFGTYTGANLASGGANRTGSCSNVSCHLKPSRRWSIER